MKIWERIRFDVAVLGCIVATVAITYGGMVDNYLFRDDFLWLSQARHDMNWATVWSHRVIGFFRPVVNLSFMFMERVVPGNIAAYNVSNLIFHTTNCYLVFRLMARLFDDRGVGAAAALIFAVTSVHFGAVGWVSGRTSLLVTFFMILSLLVATQPSRGSRGVLLSVLFYLLALFTKEVAVVGVLLVLAVHWLYRGRTDANNPITRAHLLGFLSAAVLYVALRSVILGTFTQSNWSPSILMLQNLAGGMLAQLWPSLPGVFGVTELQLRPAAGVLPEALVLLLVALVLLAAKTLGKVREVAFALGWSVICLIPASALSFRFLDMNSVLHNRYYYLSSVGVCLAWALLLRGVWERWGQSRAARAATVVVFAIVLFSGALTVRRYERTWGKGNEGVRVIVTKMIEFTDQMQEFDTLVVNTVHPEYRYLAAGVRLDRPAITLKQVSRIEDAYQYRPCAYLNLSQEGAQLAMDGGVIR